MGEQGKHRNSLRLRLIIKCASMCAGFYGPVPTRLVAPPVASPCPTMFYLILLLMIHVFVGGLA